MLKRFYYIAIYAFIASLFPGFILTGTNHLPAGRPSLADKPATAGKPAPKEDHCYTCHKGMENLPKDYSENDIHRHANLSCSSCHGGDPGSDDQEVAMSPAKGFKGVPERKEIPQFCGKCHSNIDVMRVYQPRIATDQVAQYYTSMHGRKLLAGDANVAECASCHTAHGIMSAKDPRSSVHKFNVSNTCNKCHGNAELMNKYNLPHNQLEEYTGSVHGEALLKRKDTGAPACNDCHGNHGAMPPGVTSISFVCGTCHVTNMEYFNSSKMAKAFKELDYHGCEQCHGNHGIKKPDDSMVGIEKGSKCIDCHMAGDAGFAAAQKIKESLIKLTSQYDAANSKYLEVRQKGMNDVEIGFTLQDAKQSVIQSRTLIHTFDPVRVDARTQEGIDISLKASMMAQKEIDEYYTRRNGFAAATCAFLIFAAALYFRIKDKKKKTN